MTGFADEDLTTDAFLGGKLSVLQPRKGYRAGIDPVILAAAIRAIPGQSVLELGCGAGVASLCLQKRVPDLSVTGLELQPDYADLARRNATANKLSLDVVTGDLTNIPNILRKESFDHVIANPPYFDRSAGTPATNSGRETALGEDAPLKVWVDVATRRLASKGRLTMIHKAERLPDLLKACDERLGELCIQPLIPRRGRSAKLVILQARKGVSGTFRLLDGIVLHDGPNHLSDGDDYSDIARRVLRDGKQLWVE